MVCGWWWCGLRVSRKRNVPNSVGETVPWWQGHINRLEEIWKKWSLAHDVCTVHGAFNDENYWMPSACYLIYYFSPIVWEEIKMTASRWKMKDRWWCIVNENIFMTKSNKHHVLEELNILLTARLLSIMLKIYRKCTYLEDPRVII